jgi:V8-like Glu-specific endopeptidase
MNRPLLSTLSIILGVLWAFGLSAGAPAAEKPGLPPWTQDADYDCAPSVVRAVKDETSFSWYSPDGPMSWHERRVAGLERDAVCARELAPNPHVYSQAEYQSLRQRIADQHKAAMQAPTQTPADAQFEIPIDQVEAQPMPRLVDPPNGAPVPMDLSIESTPFGPPSLLRQAPKKPSTIDPFKGQPMERRSMAAGTPLWAYDDRVAANTSGFPGRTIAYVFTTFSTGAGRCTGTFVAPNMMVTAGHCVYQTDSSGTNHVGAVSGYAAAYENGGRAYSNYGTLSGGQLFSFAAFKQQYDSAAEGISRSLSVFDTVFVVFDSAIDQAAFMPIAYGDTYTGATSQGYPANVRAAPNIATQYVNSTGSTAFSSTGFVSYPLFATPGNSGGPFIVTRNDGTSVLVGNTSTAGYDSLPISVNGPHYETSITANLAAQASTYAATVLPKPSIKIVSGPSVTSTVQAGGVASATIVALSDRAGSLSYQWTSSCSSGVGSGTFNVPTSSTPTWTAPVNTTGSAVSCTLGVTITGSLGPTLTLTTTITVQASGPMAVITSAASAAPTSVPSATATTVSVSATISGVPAVSLRYRWTDACTGGVGSGSFSFTTTSSSQATWTAPVNRTGTTVSCVLTVSVDSTSSNAPAVTSSVTVTVTGPVVTPQNGWWYSRVEPGRGYSIEVKNNRAFMAAYMYRNDGSAVWFVGIGDYAGDKFVVPLAEYAGTQTLTSTKAGGVTALPSTVTVTVTFLTSSTGSITWGGTTFSGKAVSTDIERFPFGATTVVPPSSANAPQTGWWWNASEPGVGYFIEQQSTSIFMAAYMYGATTANTWYFALSTLTSGTSVPTLATTLYQTANGQTLTGPNKTTVTNSVGAIRLVCASSTSCTLTLPSGRAVALTRFTSF